MARIMTDCVFDINCPWCYIGYVRFRKALAQHTSKWPRDSFEVDLVPFYLQPPPQLTDPETPTFTVATRSRKQLRVVTYGPVQALMVVRKIQQAAASEGLHMRFDGMTGTTRNRHPLVYHAGKVLGEAAAERTLMALFKRYHKLEIDITRLDALVEAGVEVGIAGAKEVETYLLSGQDGLAVDRLADADILDRRKEGATVGHAGGVPRFLVQGKWEVVGAREPVELLVLFERAREAAVAKEKS